MPGLKHADLEKLYSEAIEADHEIYAEQRSSVLIISGEHYNKLRRRFYDQIRDYRELSQDQRIRLTKNHVQRIVHAYMAHINSLAPGVMAVPSNEKELQDQKAAELHQAVWIHLKEKHKLRRRIRDDWLKDFCGIGECWAKIYFDPAINDLAYERIFGFNVWRDPNAQTFSESPYIGIRKMVDIDLLKSMLRNDPEKLQYVQSSAEETFVIFDGNDGTYKKNDKQVCLRECYWRPSPTYPQGYYAIWSRDGVLWEGELPFGIFPIIGAVFEEYQTNPRGHSIVKLLRPYQVEINRAASKIAEHQITLGDDKILIQNGAKLTPGGVLPGIRYLTYTGAGPMVLAGRDGSQYLQYMNSQIDEMYQVAQLDELREDKLSGQVDPFTLLFRASKQKTRFSVYAERFEDFLVDLFSVSLELTKRYYSDEMLIPAISRREYINIQEFKNVEKLCYQVKLEPRSEDIESKIGKQLVLNHALQYVGQKLDKDDIGKLMRAMPYGNFEESFDDLTMDYDNATNDILMLDRGQWPPINKYDNHKYILRRLGNRMRKADFVFLPDHVKQLYEQKVLIHQQIEADQQAALMAANQDFIPTGGYLVPIDLYVADPINPAKTRRARLPYQALDWLIKRLEAQGMSLEKLETMQQGMLAELSGMAPGQQPGALPTDMGASSPKGPASPKRQGVESGYYQPIFEGAIADESALGGASRELPVAPGTDIPLKRVPAYN